MITKPVLVDTGPLVAMLSNRDAHHQECVQEAKQLPPVLYTCWPVITEAAHLLRQTSDGVRALLSRIESGALYILALTADDVAAIGLILDKYHDQSFDFADACLMHLAEREAVEHVFTLDRRDFSLFRRHDGALELLPRL